MNKGWGRNKTDFDVQFGNAVMFAREEEPLYQECLEGRKKVLGPDHPDTLVTMDTFASFLKKRAISPMQKHRLDIHLKVIFLLSSFVPKAKTRKP